MASLSEKLFFKDVNLEREYRKRIKGEIEGSFGFGIGVIFFIYF
jgi:hypothetical protein